MVSVDMLRARWTRADDDELVAAHYYGDLTPDGQRAVAAELEARMGALDAFEARAAAEQGPVLGRITVTRLTNTSGHAALPPMRGAVVFAEGGVGFVPAGRCHDPTAAGLVGAGRSVGGALGHPGLGGLAGVVVGGLVESALATKHRVYDRTRSPLPLPLLARADHNALWIGATPAGEVAWTALGGKIWHQHRLQFACDAASDAVDGVLAWADLVGWTVLALDDVDGPIE